MMFKLEFTRHFSYPSLSLTRAHAHLLARPQTHTHRDTDVHTSTHTHTHTRKHTCCLLTGKFLNEGRFIDRLTVDISCPIREVHCHIDCVCVCVPCMDMCVKYIEFLIILVYVFSVSMHAHNSLKHILKLHIKGPIKVSQILS